MNSDAVYWIAFNKLRIFKAQTLLTVKKELGNLRNFWSLGEDDFAEVTTLLNINTDRKWRKYLEKKKDLDFGKCALEATLATRNKIKIITPDNENYPDWFLDTISDPPLVLYVRGELFDTPNKAIAIVGTRNPSYYGRTKTKKIAKNLAKAGYIIVSGLARGIDCAAHLGALDAREKTVAVLANGLLKHPTSLKADSRQNGNDLVVYPPEHSELVEDILENKGAVISESPFGSNPRSFRLLDRNRIVAGLTCASLAIEGGSRTGTASEINHAHKMGRWIFALVPKDRERKCAQFPQYIIDQGIGVGIKSGADILNRLQKAESPPRLTEFIENSSR